MNDKDMDDYIRGTESAAGHIGRMHREAFATPPPTSPTFVSSRPAKSSSRDGYDFGPVVPRPPLSKGQIEANRRRGAAVLGFMGAGWWALQQPEATLTVAGVIGLIAAAVMYKFYKPILVIALLAGAIALFSRQ